METFGVMVAPDGVAVHYSKEHGTVTVTEIEDRNGNFRKAEYWPREVAVYQVWLNGQPAA